MSRFRFIALGIALVVALGISIAPAAHAHGITHKTSSISRSFTARHISPRCVIDGDGCDDEHCNVELNNEGCDGADPIAGNCTDGKTIASAYIPEGPGGYVELRYSAICKSKWGRVYTADGSKQNLSVFVERVPSAPDGGKAMYSASGFGNIWYSDMVFAPQAGDQAYACGSINSRIGYCTETK